MLQQKHWHVGSSYDGRKRWQILSWRQSCHWCIQAHLASDLPRLRTSSELQCLQWNAQSMAKNTDSKLHTRNTRNMKMLSEEKRRRHQAIE